MHKQSQNRRGVQYLLKLHRIFLSGFFRHFLLLDLDSVGYIAYKSISQQSGYFYIFIMFKGRAFCSTPSVWVVFKHKTDIINVFLESYKQFFGK